MDDFEIELKNGFLEEASMLLADTEQCFLAIEQNAEDTENINKIFRLAHNLKGSSKAVGFDQMGSFTHEFETFILRIKNGELAVHSGVVSLLLICNDFLLKMVAELKTNHASIFEIDELIERMRSQSNADVTVASQEVASPSETSSEASLVFSPPEVPDASEFSEISEAPARTIVDEKVDFSTKPTSIPESSSTAPPKPQVAEDSIRVSISKLENLLNFVGEMAILHSVMKEQTLQSSSPLLKKTVTQLAKVGKEIQDISMSLRMIPVKNTFQKMQRIVRDTSKAVNKEVTLNLVGEETELDKTILEKINDPLVHLIRNSVDHGIELPEVRAAKGKNPKGQVNLSAFHKSGRLVIEVKDDGGGLDAEKLKRKAIEKGLLSANNTLTEQESFALIFAPGFSTKENVTDVSGRGVGMDVVKTNIQDLSGEIQIESRLGEGTTIRIILPLTLAIIDGMVVTFAREKFVMPLNHVHETLNPKPEQMQFLSGVGNVLILRGESMPLYRIGDFFDKKSTLSSHEMIAMIVRSGPKPYALLVEDILGQLQVVIKQLGPELSHIKGISGSTILGDGKPALIIEPPDLFKKSNGRAPPALLEVKSA